MKKSKTGKKGKKTLKKKRVCKDKAGKVVPCKPKVCKDKKGKVVPCKPKVCKDKNGKTIKCKTAKKRASKKIRKSNKPKQRKLTQKTPTQTLPACKEQEEEEIPMDHAAIKAYSSVIADAAEDSEPAVPVEYREMPRDDEEQQKSAHAELGADPFGSMIQNEIAEIKDASIKAAKE